MLGQVSGTCGKCEMCVMKSLPVVSISSYAPPAHCRASGAASGGALGRSAPPRAARAPPFSFLPNTEKLPFFSPALISTFPSEYSRHLQQRHAVSKLDAPRRIDGPHAARRPDLDGARHSSRGAAAAANKGASATHSDPQVRTRQHAPRTPQQPLTRAVWLCVRPVACSSLTPRRARRCANAEARRRRLNIL